MGAVIDIVICVIIVMAIKKKKQKRAENGDASVNQSKRSGKRTIRQGAQPYGTAMRGAQPYGMQPPGTQPQGAQQPGQYSTTGYLNEKAKLDEAEHEKEKEQEQLAVQKAYGGHPVAMRLYEGDSVPSGKMCVKCGYCGAENLVPWGSRTKYSCYFCREVL